MIRSRVALWSLLTALALPFYSADLMGDRGVAADVGGHRTSPSGPAAADAVPMFPGYGMWDPQISGLFGMRLGTGSDPASQALRAEGRIRPAATENSKVRQYGSPIADLPYCCPELPWGYGLADGEPAAAPLRYGPATKRSRTAGRAMVGDLSALARDSRHSRGAWTALRLNAEQDRLRAPVERPALRSADARRQPPPPPAGAVWRPRYRSDWQGCDYGFECASDCHYPGLRNEAEPELAEAARLPRVASQARGDEIVEIVREDLRDATPASPPAVGKVRGVLTVISLLLRHAGAAAESLSRELGDWAEASSESTAEEPSAESARQAAPAGRSGYRGAYLGL